VSSSTYVRGTRLGLTLPSHLIFPHQNRKPYKPFFRCPFRMTSRKEEDEEGILERMLERLGLIGRNVERLVDRVDFYNTGTERKNHDEWSADELYNNENGEC
jgi:hypothetical protein